MLLTLFNKAMKHFVVFKLVNVSVHFYEFFFWGAAMMKLVCFDLYASRSERT